jgi:hypothetical protein
MTSLVGATLGVAILPAMLWRLLSAMVNREMAVPWVLPETRSCARVAYCSWRLSTVKLYYVSKLATLRQRLPELFPTPVMQAQQTESNSCKGATRRRTAWAQAQPTGTHRHKHKHNARGVSVPDTVTRLVMPITF